MLVLVEGGTSGSEAVAFGGDSKNGGDGGGADGGVAASSGDCARCWVTKSGRGDASRESSRVGGATAM